MIPERLWTQWMHIPMELERLRERKQQLEGRSWFPQQLKHHNHIPEIDRRGHSPTLQYQRNHLNHQSPTLTGRIPGDTSTQNLARFGRQRPLQPLTRMTDSR